ncbi:hypothetical protein B0H12DRAFT_1278861, partial [Mycena haematopus]
PKHYKSASIPPSIFTRTHSSVVQALLNKHVLQALRRRCLCAHYPCCRQAVEHPSPGYPPTSDQCCASVVPASSSSASAVAALLGLDLSGLLVDWRHHGHLRPPRGGVEYVPAATSKYFR